MTRPTYIFRDDTNGTRWCILRSALPGGRITTLCSDSLVYSAVLVLTTHPGDQLCPACRTEVAAGTPGGAEAIEPASSRVDTADLRCGRRSEWS